MNRSLPAFLICLLHAMFLCAGPEPFGQASATGRAADHPELYGSHRVAVPAEVLIEIVPLLDEAEHVSRDTMLRATE